MQRQTAARATFALIALTTLLQALPAQAACRSLKAIMKDMDGEYKFVTRNYTNESQRSSVLGAAERLGAFASEAIPCPPSAVLNLPEPQRSQALAQYADLLGRVVSLNNQFRAAFDARDMGSATARLHEINDVRREGHHIFD